MEEGEGGGGGEWGGVMGKVTGEYDMSDENERL